MANNKVVFGQEVLIDLTQDTVTPYALEEGYTAHAPSGEKIVGVMKPNKPVEVETNAEMTAISTGATEKDLGKVYLFVGEDDGVFEKDALYILVKKGTGYGFQRYAIGGSGEESTPLQEKSVEITENGTKEVLPDEGYALSKVIVTTNVAGREDLDAELNEQEALIAELKEKLANGGGGSGGSCIIDVTKLPTGYKDVDVYVRFDASEYYTFLQFLQMSLAEMGVSFLPNLTYYVVDTLPTEGEVSDVTTLTSVHCYIANNIPYVYGDFGGGNMWMAVSAVIAEALGMPIPDNGFTSDITTTTDAGLYVTYKEGEKPVEGAVYRLPPEIEAEVYVVNDDGIYQSLSDALNGSTVITHVVETLPEYLIAPADRVTHVYVVDGTGVAYINTGVDAWGVMSLGAYFTALAQAFGNSVTCIDGGWTDNIAAETGWGCYCVRKQDYASLNVFSGGAWESYIDDDAKVEFNEVKLVNKTLIVKNQTLTSENKTITKQNEYLNIKVNGLDATDVGTVNFAKFCSLYTSNGQIMAGGTMHAITQVTIPLEAVGLVEYAFDRNATLERVTIKTGVTSIGVGAFRSCGMLTSIIYSGTKAQWKAISFGSYWDDGTGNYAITCTDGTIAKDGTET